MIKVCAGFSELLPVKNVAGVINACRKLDVKLWIVGAGGEESRLKRIAGKNVKFYGRVPNAAVRKIMGNSDIFVLNSLHEGMPHALLEALAEKVPVVATKIPAVTEILTDGETGLLVGLGSDQQLTAAIKRLAGDQALRKKLAENGRKLFEQKFTWASHLQQLYNVFDEAVNRSVGGSSS
ncbi:MAG: glycosyltransferase family 4 protein [Patescibacteria group bacterium]|nr:glycosyltransferase family 4 protein [Patescibacteria group bacterium]MCL5431683.1 glycosyltransferase family 4 protein [Patescibacteria group bacterium]